MIARLFRARTSRDNVVHYRAFLNGTVFPTIAELPGFVEAELLERDDGEAIELLVLTRWQSLDSIRDFAGDTLDTAVVEPEARALLADYDESVRHFAVTLEFGR